MKKKLIEVQNLWKMKINHHGVSPLLHNKLQNMYPRPVVGQLSRKLGRA